MAQQWACFVACRMSGTYHSQVSVRPVQSSTSRHCPLVFHIMKGAKNCQEIGERLFPQTL